MTMWRMELRTALRGLLRSPSFTLPTLVILAVGIGTTAAIFAVVEGILLSPLPYPDDGELVSFCEESPSFQGYCVASVPTALDMHREVGSLEGAGAYRSWSWILTEDGESTGVAGGIASPAVFSLLGATPAAGRFFRPDEIGPDRDDVAVLSHSFWQQRYGSDPDVVGRTLSLDGDPVTVVGVLPAGFEVPEVEWVTVWRPLHVDPADEERRTWRGFETIARLADGVSLPRARSEMEAFYGGLTERTDAVTADWSLRVPTLRDKEVGNVRRPLVAFLVAAGLLLLVVSANVANLLLARGVRREREFAVRTALGAGRGHLVGRVIMESAILTGVAGAAGLLLSLWGVDLFVALAPPGIPRLEQARVDLPVVLFAGVVSVAVVLLAGLVPALRLRDVEVASSLRDGREGADGPRGTRTRRALVVAELALSLVLLFGTGLLVRTFQGYVSWDPGFEREGLYTVSAFASPGQYETRPELFSLWARVEEALEGTPGVVAAGSASTVPLRGGRETSKIRSQGMEGVPEQELPGVRWYDVGPTFFETLGVPVVAGRDIRPADALGSAPVALVNETFAHRTWPGQEAVGRWVSVAGGEATEERLEVVGVVADVPPLTPGEAPEPEVYWSNRQFGRWGTIFLVRTAPGAEGAAAAIRDRMLEVEPRLSLGAVEGLDALVDRRLAGPRFNLWLMAAFGGVATLLGLVGLYGVLAYDVAQRARVIGIRIALGSTPERVVRGVLSEAGLLAVAGVVLGAAGAWLVSGLVGSMVRGVSATDPLTLAATAGVLVALALAAAVGPALRASRLDPARLLRE